MSKRKKTRASTPNSKEQSKSPFPKGKGLRPVPQNQNVLRTVRGFIVTQSSLPTDTEAEANRALFDRCIKTQGFIRLRLEPRVYDPQSKRYVSLLGESINLTVLSREAMEALILEIRQGLLDEERKQRAS